jgi:hypothetical protein
MANLRTITERVLREQKIDLLTPKEFHSAMRAIFSEMLLAAPKRTKALAGAMAEKDIKALDVANLLDLSNDMAKEIEGLKLALGVAVSQLYFSEPGDSRAVSDVFVSLASVVAGDANEACFDILADERKRLDALDTEAVRQENQDSIKISVRVGRTLDDYPLPTDVLDNKSVASILDFLRRIPNEELRFLSKRAIANAVGDTAIEAEIDYALSALTREELAILTPVWMFADPETGEEYRLSDEERRMVSDNKLFIHPESGVEVADYRDHIGHYWALNTSNAEFLAWKAVAEPKGMTP